MLFSNSALKAAFAPANNPSFATATVRARTSGALTVAKGVLVVNSRTKESVSLLPYMSCLIFVDNASLSCCCSVVIVSCRNIIGRQSRRPSRPVFCVPPSIIIRGQEDEKKHIPPSLIPSPAA
jgi:hypothetical protein